MTLDISELEKELQRLKSTVDTWAAGQHQAAVDTKEKHAAWLRDQHAVVASMDDKYYIMRGTSAQIKQRLEKEQQEVAELQQASTALRAEKDVLQRRVVAMQDQLVAHEMESQRKESEAMLEENNKRKKIAALRRALSLYSSRLGLEFKQGPDELQLVMTQVQQSNPEREFSVAVRVQPDNTYQVTSCTPMVDRLPDLVQQLNTSNDFSQFVKSLRVEFQAYANKQAVH